MHMSHHAKIKRKRIMISVAVLITTVISFNMFLFNTDEVQAKTTLPGIEKVVSMNETEKPFVIVEILPSLSDARLGYLVSGEEPVNNNADSLSTMPSKSERQDKMNSAKSIPVDLNNAVSLLEENYEETDTSLNSMKIYGSFYEVESNTGNYTHESNENIYEKPAEINDMLDGSTTLYNKCMTFKTDNGEGNYSLLIKKMDDSESLNGIKLDNTDCYNHQFFVASIIEDENFTNAENGDYLFKADSSGDSMEYYATYDENNLTSDMIADFSSFYIVREAQGTDEGEELYYVKAANSLDTAPFLCNISYGAIRVDEDGTYTSRQDDTEVYVKQTAMEEYRYEGNNQGDFLFNQDYTGELQSEFLYSSGFLNSEWIEKYVFDIDSEEHKDMVIDVVPITPDKITNYLLNRADLIYISGGTYPSDADVSTEMAVSLFHIVSEGIPTIVNRSVADTNENPENIKKLTQDIIKEKTHDYISSAMSYVCDNLFVFDDTGHNLIDNNFIISFSEQEIEAGFEDILKEIDSENHYLEVAGKEEQISRIASPASAFRYVINSGKRRVVTKEKLSILDLEPCDSQSYYESDYVKKELGKENSTVDKIDTDSIYISNGSLSKNWIIENFATQFSEKDDHISVTMMGTREFVGKKEKLSENYDFIYIGTDTSLLNTVINNGKKSAETVYNDDSMDGLVYTHTGDAVLTKSIIGGSKRMSGNDITVDKLRELNEYVENGHAVLLSDRFFITEGENISINTKIVDSSSNLYTFLNKTVLIKNDDNTYKYFGNNVNKKSNLIGDSEEVTNAREKFSKYMSISKLILQYDTDDLPIEYNQNDGSNKYLSPDEDGRYRLEYQISLKNDTATQITDSTYDCGLFIDYNNDGNFDSKEKLDGINIIDVEDDSQMEMNSSDKYELSVGSTYHIEKDVPEGYTGFLPWKIIFTANDNLFSSDNSGIEKSITGFCAVPSNTLQPEVKILQIYPSNEIGTIDLSDRDMEALYSQINDFNIKVTRLSATDYIQKTEFITRDYIDYLNDFDMIVLGFNQNYNFGGESPKKCRDAILAIREYVLSGRSILFSHDVNSIILNENSMISPWGYYANMYLRDIQGMDRYGIISDGANIPSDDKYLYHSRYDVASINGNFVDDNIGFTDMTIMSHKEESIDYGQNARSVTYNVTQDTSTNSIITKLNAGQISEYPFKIPDILKVSRSHAQYYQLNLDTDSTDDKDDDVVVWYTLTGMENESDEDNFYRANKCDARNHYYIYNKGNVTYTGSGENVITDMGERMLLVNTMLAAYNAGLHSPTVDYKESTWKSSPVIKCKYVPYDPIINDNNGSFLEKKLIINFYTNNKNYRSNKELHAKYYVEENASDYDVCINNKYLKEIHPSSFEKVSESDDQLIKTIQNCNILDNYSMYTMSFTMDELHLSNDSGTLNNVNCKNIFVRLGCDELKEGKTLSSVPASESLNKLSVVCTQLFVLK